MKNFHIGERLLHGGDYFPEQWIEEPDVLNRDIELMKEAGFNVVTLGVFAWSVLEPEEGVYRFDWLDRAITNLSEAGIATILATPSGARPPWLAERYPEVLRTLADGRRARFGGRHNHCPSSERYREKVASINGELATRFGGREEVVLWHVSNEYQGSCYCNKCAKAFREWLKQEHDNDLDLLNKRWWSRFWSHVYTKWEQIEPPYSHGEQQLHGLVIDWKRFQADQIVDFCEHEVRALREHDRETPTTVNLMGLHNSVRAGDLARTVEVVSGDIYPTWGAPPGEADGMLHTVPANGDLFRNYAFTLSLYRGLAAPMRGRLTSGAGSLTTRRGSWLLMESTPSHTNWHPVGAAKPEGAHLLSSLAAIAMDSASVQYFQWRQGRGGWEQFHGSVIKHDGSTGRPFKAVTELATSLNALTALSEPTARTAGSEDDARPAPIAPKVPVARAAIILDDDSRWMISQASGPRNDGRRSPVETAMRHFQEISCRGVECDVVAPDTSLDGYSLVVLPMTAYISPTLAKNLRHIASRGVPVVATYFSGVFDRWMRLTEARPPAADNGPLGIFGVSVQERDMLYRSQQRQLVWAGGAEGERASVREYTEQIEAAEGTTIHARYDDGPFSGEAIITQRGSAWYVAARLDDDGLRLLYDRVLPELKRADWETEGVTIYREIGGAQLLFLFNARDYPISVSLGQVGDRRVAVTKAASVSAAKYGGTDALRLAPSALDPILLNRATLQEEVPGNDGRLCTLESWGTAVFRLSPRR